LRDDRADLDQQPGLTVTQQGHVGTTSLRFSNRDGEPMALVLHRYPELV